MPKNKEYTLKEVQQALKNAYGDLKFNEEEHKYSVGTHTFKRSTTKFIEEFHGSFNKFMMAPIMAKNHKRNNPGSQRTSDWYVSYWNCLGDEARAKGRRVHLYGECYPDFPEPRSPEEKGIRDWWKRLPKKYEVVAMELMMYNRKLNLVGTADILIRNKDTGKFIIADYKTNAANLIQNYGNKKLKPPFKDMPDTKLNHYKIQLSVYQLIFESTTPFEVEDRWIIWTKQGDYTKVDEGKDPKKYKITKERADKSGRYYKQFNVPDLSQSIHQWIIDQQLKRAENDKSRKR